MGHGLNQKLSTNTNNQVILGNSFGVMMCSLFWGRWRDKPDFLSPHIFHPTIKKKEHIDGYLASCRRARSLSLDDDEDNYDDEDTQTQREFDEFKTWLDSSTPATSDTRPSEVVMNPKECPKCKTLDCD